MFFLAVPKALVLWTSGNKERIFVFPECYLLIKLEYIQFLPQLQEKRKKIKG